MRLYPAELSGFPHEPTSEQFAVRVVDARRGEGVVALVPFACGEIVFAFRGTIQPQRTLYTLQVSPSEHLHDPYFLGKVLHQCDPNCDVDMRVQQFIARRTIAVGEAVTMDYAQTEDVLFRDFHCCCRSTNCRGWITGRHGLVRCVF